MSKCLSRYVSVSIQMVPTPSGTKVLQFSLVTYTSDLVKLFLVCSWISFVTSLIGAAKLPRLGTSCHEEKQIWNCWKHAWTFFSPFLIYIINFWKFSLRLVVKRILHLALCLHVAEFVILQLSDGYLQLNKLLNKLRKNHWQTWVQLNDLSMVTDKYTR